jgi:hypothetical protein
LVFEVDEFQQAILVIVSWHVLKMDPKRLSLALLVILYLGDFQKNEDFSFSENNLNIK